MAISATDVKNLRELTGAGMMECKKALEETGGDFDKAVEALRISGAAKAAKRGAERSTSNGLVASSGSALISLLCETDFVAKNDDFQKLAQKIAAAVDAGSSNDLETALSLSVGDKSVAEEIEALSAVIGEKLELGKVARFSGDVAVYLHKRSEDLPPQVGVLVEFSGNPDTARAIAMQIAAMRPLYVNSDEVPSDVIESEKRIAEATAKEEGKPEAALPKIVEGRVQGFLKEVVLVMQPSVQDSKKSVQQVLDETGTSISRFARFDSAQ